MFWKHLSKHIVYVIYFVQAQSRSTPLLKQTCLLVPEQLEKVFEMKKARSQQEELDCVKGLNCGICGNLLASYWRLPCVVSECVSILVNEVFSWYPSIPVRFSLHVHVYHTDLSKCSGCLFNVGTYSGVGTFIENNNNNKKSITSSFRFNKS